MYAHLKKGVITEFSVGFDVDKRADGSEDVELKGGVRYIKSIHPWYEWSPVLMGANPETMPLSVKSASVTKSAPVMTDVRPSRKRRRFDDEDLREHWARAQKQVELMRQAQVKADRRRFDDWLLSGGI